MYKSFKTLSIILATLVGVSTTFAQADTRILVVADEMVSCWGVVDEQCMKVRGEEDSRWQILRTKIENFKFVRGYTYVLAVKTTGNSRNEYRLKEIVSRIKTIGKTADNKLAGSSWRLTRLRGRMVRTPHPTLDFSATENRISGSGGCNRFFADYSSTKTKLSVKAVGSTRKLCPTGMQTEAAYFEVLKGVTRYRISRNKLFLYSGSRVVLEFERQAE